jgi:hypothetical protein
LAPLPAVGPPMETSHKSLGSYKFTDGWHPFDQMEINSARQRKSR